MKKSVLFGVLAFFAVSAMSVQNANAQNTTVKKSAKTEQKATLSTNKAQAQPASENAKPDVKPINTQKEYTEAEKEAMLKNGQAPKQVKAAEKQVKNDAKAADKKVKKEVKKGEKMTKAKRDEKAKAAESAKPMKSTSDKKVKK